jgi:hypothetical protein
MSDSGSSGSAMPERIVVGPFVYRIVQDVAKLQAHEREKKGAYSGYSDHAAMEIVVGPDESLCSQRETLWHEVKHCVVHLFGEYGKMDDETYIRRTAPMELAVLRSNPALVAYLLGEDEGGRDAAQEGLQQEVDQQEHQDRDEGRQGPEASGRDRAEHGARGPAEGRHAVSAT